MTKLLRQRSWAAAIAAAMLLRFAAAAHAGVALEPAAIPGGNTYTIVVDPLATWSQAAEDAAVGGGHLATITSAAEQAFMEQLLAKAGVPAGAYWIGLQKSSVSYEWTTGEPLVYTNWLAGQPDDNGGNESVGAILWSNTGDNSAGTSGSWNDLPERYLSGASVYADLNNGGYIVERSAGAGNGDSPAAVPLPAAALLAPAGMLLAALSMRWFRRARN